jgi:hypothetical protein
VKDILKKFARVATGLVLALTAAGCTGSGADTVENSGSSGTTNRAPTISASPASAVNVDQVWTVTPSVSDPDGDSLTFMIDNTPGWATFNFANGVLEGMPSSGDIGIYADIRITVSDGSLSDVLGPFSVEVTQVALGSATVNFALPTQYNDGTLLSGRVRAVNIYYGVSQGNYPNMVEITNVGMTSYVFENLVPDTYYFVATIVDDQGAESGFSSISSVLVQ